MEREFLDKSLMKWKAKSEWYPEKQNAILGNVDQVYNEVRSKYGEQLYEELAKQKRLNDRLHPHRIESDFEISHLAELKNIKTLNSMYGRFPQHKYEIALRKSDYEKNLKFD